MFFCNDFFDRTFRMPDFHYQMILSRDRGVRVRMWYGTVHILIK